MTLNSLYNCEFAFATRGLVSSDLMQYLEFSFPLTNVQNPYGGEAVGAADLPPTGNLSSGAGLFSSR